MTTNIANGLVKKMPNECDGNSPDYSTMLLLALVMGDHSTVRLLREQGCELDLDLDVLRDMGASPELLRKMQS